MSKFDIDEVICEEKMEAMRQYTEAKRFKSIYGDDTPGFRVHNELGDKHGQIAEWLEELKKFKEKT